jgi:hypothetical protein
LPSNQLETLKEVSLLSSPSRQRLEAAVILPTLYLALFLPSNQHETLKEVSLLSSLFQKRLEATVILPTLYLTLFLPSNQLKTLKAVSYISSPFVVFGAKMSACLDNVLKPLLFFLPSISQYICLRINSKPQRQ